MVDKVGRITFGHKKKGIMPDHLGRGDAREMPSLEQELPQIGEVICRLPGDYQTEVSGENIDLRGEDMNQPKNTTKDPYNPKDAVGVRKWRQFTTIPWTVLWELGVAMLEGARKYGRHNYRAAPVRASVYLDAAVAGHIMPFWEGEDLDPDTGLSHVTKAIASLTVLRDAMIQGKWIDDRPPKTDMEAFRTEMQQRVDEIFERIPEAKAAFLEGDQHGSD